MGKKKAKEPEPPAKDEVRVVKMTIGGMDSWLLNEMYWEVVDYF
jgi:hypothetical protein